MPTPSFSGGSPKWWQSGHRPDYRFSLANERTFLAWIRTALALIAGAVGIDQFAVHLGSAPIRTALAMTLFGAGGVLAATAYRRWAAAEAAMRNDADLPTTGLMPALAAVATLLAIAVAAVMLAY